MDSQFRKIYSWLLQYYKGWLWVAIAEIATGVIKRLCLNPIKIFFNEHLKLHLLDQGSSKQQQQQNISVYSYSYYNAELEWPSVGIYTASDKRSAW